MIEFADRLDRLLQLLIIGQPAAHLRNMLGAQAELPRLSTWVAHSENREGVTFAARAFCAALAMVADGSLEQRAAQDLAGHRQPVEQLLARRYGSLI
jgi:hypothetical protein